MKFEYRDIPAEPRRAGQEGAQTSWSRPRPKTTEELMNKYLEGGELTEAEIIAGIRARHARRARSSRCSAARRSRTRACRRCSTPSSQLPAGRRSDRPPVKGMDENDKEDRRARRRRRAVLGARVQDHDRSVRRLADVLPRLFGRAELRRHGLQPGQGQEGAHRPHPADAREPSATRSRKCAPATSPPPWV